MGSLGATQFICLLLAVALAGATGGFIASTAVRSNKRRTRGVFLVGFFCGVMAALVARRRKHGASRLAVRSLSSSVLPVRLGVSPRLQSRPALIAGRCGLRGSHTKQ